ncbi:hypothetical protein D0Z07_7494 [Hyphodiscus hymeniophilus]|uniref:Uncharacterized protein n=1 Tax=Hyphodiscus hymeniophilus TaxID=353542 RepID=A0A9P7AUG1_9HELO|nr:hypothetical protein D0Z07_7494 [Hyphodiscus hymeniophilus]
MILITFFLLGFAAFVLADPIPQAAATTDLGSFTTDSGSSPSDMASMSDSLASLSSLLSLESGMPTLASFAESVLLTAVPTDVQTGDLCQTTTPGWYKSLPGDVKSALSSYDSAFASWYSVHSTDLDLGLTSDLTATLPGNVCAGTVFASATTEPTSAATPSTGPSTAARGTTATITGTAATGSETAASGSPSSSSSTAAAPHATEAVGFSVAGIVGVLGLMAAL